MAQSESIIAAVGRCRSYSPNNVKNDAAILEGVSAILEAGVGPVRRLTEEEFLGADITEPIVVNMCRLPESIAKLQSLEREGRLVVNSGFGIERCAREHFTRLMLEHGIPCPESLIVDTDCPLEGILEANGFSNCWVKRGDGYSLHKEDVTYVRHAEEAEDILKEYRLRGIRRAVINRHLAGDLVKFYGVCGTGFFYFFYPYDHGHSKFGLERKNGASHRYPFDETCLQRVCEKFASILGVTVYGGDCIVTPEGEVSIIDFNDWPSFAPCRAQAARAIARAVEVRAEARHLEAHNR